MDENSEFGKSLVDVWHPLDRLISAYRDRMRSPPTSAHEQFFPSSSKSAATFATSPQGGILSALQNLLPLFFYHLTSIFFLAL